METPLRLILFLGLVSHKLLWEVLKRRDQVPRTQQTPAKKPLTSLIKASKSLVLVFIMIQTLFLDVFPIASQPNLLRITGIVIYLTGLTVAITSRLQLGKNWVDLEDYQVLPEQSLVTNGIYRLIRHPIYTGDVLLLVGLELALNSWLVLGVVIPLVFAVRNALKEETLLSQSFPGYDAYCERTKRFIPFIV